MGAPKGAYNARAYQDAEAGKVRGALAQSLATLGRTGLVFKNISALATHVAGVTGQTPGNLRRNKVYREMLESHLYRQRGTAGLIADRDRDVNVLKAKLRTAELEAANVARDKARLERFVAQNMPTRRPDLALAAPSAPDRPEKGDYRKAFECTAQALERVLERAEFFAVNQKTKTIEDRSARPGHEEVVGAAHAKFFVEWLSDRVKISAR